MSGENPLLLFVVWVSICAGLMALALWVLLRDGSWCPIHRRFYSGWRWQNPQCPDCLRLPSPWNGRG